MRYGPTASGRGPTAVAAALGVALALAACSASPISEVRTADAPPSATPPSLAPASAQPSATDAAPTPTTGPPATPLAVPAKPSNVTWALLGQEPLGDGVTRMTYRVTWTAPARVASRFTVVGITRCLRDARRFDGKPCLVKGMRIPKDAQEVIAQVPGDARSVDVSWKTGELGPGPYRSVLLRASNDAGNSTFAIAWSDTVCWQCTD